MTPPPVPKNQGRAGHPVAPVRPRAMLASPMRQTNAATSAQDDKRKLDSLLKAGAKH